MIITFTRPVVVGIVALLLAAGSGCSRGPADEPAAKPVPDAAAVTRQAAGELLGALKLLRQEYGNAVAAGGATVVDATEYAETELFAEQAERKLAAWRAAGGLPDAAAADRLAQSLARIRAAIARKAPHAAVVDEATAAIAVVQESLAGAVPETIRGAVLATDRADQAIAAEEIAGEYRIGVVSGPARQLFRRDGEGATLSPEPAAAAGAVYVGVVLRERRTKRLLSAAEVGIVIDGQGGGRVESHLDERWGDFHQYGANMVLPADGPATVTVRVAPPAYARHGDMLNVFVTPVAATLAAHVREKALAFDARPVTPTDKDYAVGDDVLQAVAEAGELRDAGPYRVGLIVEGPEPIWLWRDGKPLLQPVTADATNHVEVVLVDRETGQLVPRAGVTVTFLAAGTKVGTAALQPLLSIFSHYGQTLALPVGTRTVEVRVTPPPIGSLDRPRLADPATIVLPLPTRRKEAE